VTCPKACETYSAFDTRSDVCILSFTFHFLKADVLLSCPINVSYSEEILDVNHSGSVVSFSFPIQNGCVPRGENENSLSTHHRSKSNLCPDSDFTTCLYLFHAVTSTKVSYYPQHHPDDRCQPSYRTVLL
jgi:hypothetical protein